MTTRATTLSISMSPDEGASGASNEDIAAALRAVVKVMGSADWVVADLDDDRLTATLVRPEGGRDLYRGYTQVSSASSTSDDVRAALLAVLENLRDEVRNLPDAAVQDASVAVGLLSTTVEGTDFVVTGKVAIATA